MHKKKRVTQRAHGGFRRVGAADVGPHADLEDHAFQCHRVCLLLVGGEE